MRANVILGLACAALLIFIGGGLAAVKEPPATAPTTTAPASAATASTALPAAPADLGEIMKRLQEAQAAPFGTESPPWQSTAKSITPDHLNSLREAVTTAPDARQRTAALNDLVALQPESLPAALTAAAPAEKDPVLRAAEVLLLGMTRDVAVLPVLRARLKDGDPRVRAAAADALGIVRRPTYPIAIIRASDWMFSGSRDLQKQAYGANAAITFTDPPLIIEGLIKLSRYGTTRPKVIEMDHRLNSELQKVPAEIRDDLLAVMMGGETSVEREAAARALVDWPPEKFKFRLAEWGVWIADGGNIVLPQTILDEIPPFVHRTGNPLGQLGDRINYIMSITKPVVHLTTDQPLAVDLEVRIEFGRPYVAYPKPDDFGLAVGTSYGFRQAAEKAGLIVQGAFLDQLDNKKVAALEDIREGYPWLWPNHRRYGATSGGMAAGGNYITQVGLRWQSLIVSPKSAAWMKPPEVPAKPAFAWWAPLRNVPSAWVSSRGETERFLYYDGPTLARTPVKVSLRGDRLTFTPQAMIDKEVKDGLRWDRQEAPTSTPIPGVGDKPGLPRTGVFIRVTGGKAVAWVVTVPEDSDTAFLVRGEELSGDAATAAVQRLAVEGGLTREEAAGMVAAWHDHWFVRDGQRFLLRLSAIEYNAICPIVVRPAPTEGARLGLVMTEFAEPPPR